MKRTLLLLALLGALLPLMAGAAQIPVAFTFPSTERNPDGACLGDSGSAEGPPLSTLKEVRLYAVRYADMDTVILGVIPAVGREGQRCSLSVEVLGDTMTLNAMRIRRPVYGNMWAIAVELGGKESCAGSWKTFVTEAVELPPEPVAPYSFSTAPLDWVDISTTGTRIDFTGDDQNRGPFPLSIDFPFYGDVFTALRVCTNGWLSFNSSATNYPNTTLPNDAAGTPPSLIAPFWDDLAFTYGGTAYWQGWPDRFVVSWNDVRRVDGGGTYSFQVVLYPTGDFDLQYLSMVGQVASATIGIQNQAKDAGLLVSMNQAFAQSGLCVRFTRSR